jgi:hypothetical protein
MSGVTFTDSIENNLEIIRELLRGLPPETRHQAKLAAAIVERAITDIHRDAQGNRGAALGTAFAVYMFAQQFVAADQGGDGQGDNLIQLLN